MIISLNTWLVVERRQRVVERSETYIERIIRMLTVYTKTLWMHPKFFGSHNGKSYLNSVLVKTR